MASTQKHKSSRWNKVLHAIKFGQSARTRKADKRIAEEKEHKENLEAFLEPGKETQRKWLEAEHAAEQASEQAAAEIAGNAAVATPRTVKRSVRFQPG
jgi:hypothetical protein